jgi:hypothetical protein
MRTNNIARWAGLLAAALLVVPLPACDEILNVDNPEEISVNELNDEALLDAQVAGVIDAFTEQTAGTESGLIQGGTFLTDETVTGLNWEDWQRANQRVVNYIEGPVYGIWENLSETLRNGEETLHKLDSLATDPTEDRRVALVAALVGYTYMLIGEHICQAVFSSQDSLGSTVYDPPEVFAKAIPFFNRALTVGGAGGHANIVNLAHVGLARTYLNLADFGNAMQHAQAVTAGFQWWVDYSNATTDLWNNLYDETHGTNHTIGVHPNFLNGTYGTQDLVATQTDPRLQHTSRFTTGHDQSTKLYKPYQGLRFSGYTGAAIADGAAEGNGDNGDLILFQTDTDVLLADYVEARHHYYEAMLRSGGAEAQVLQWVNDRRAVGNQPPVSLTGAALFAELRRQRSIDLYMGGFRLGDLRRWKRDGVGDFFPTGVHPNPDRLPGVYGAWTCWPLPIEEYEGNENLSKPANPLDPPGV